MIYPCIASWGLDPLYSSFRKMIVASIHSDIVVVTKQLYYEMYLCSRPIKKVEIMGVVVSTAKKIYGKSKSRILLVQKQNISVT